MTGPSNETNSPTRREFIATAAGAATVAASSSVALAARSVPETNQILTLLQDLPSGDALNDAFNHAISAIWDVEGSKPFLVELFVDCMMRQTQPCDEDNAGRAELRALAPQIRRMQLEETDDPDKKVLFLERCRWEAGDMAAKEAFKNAFQGDLVGPLLQCMGQEDIWGYDRPSAVAGEMLGYAVDESFKAADKYLALARRIEANRDSPIIQAAEVAGIASDDAEAEELEFQLAHAIKLAKRLNTA